MLHIKRQRKKNKMNKITTMEATPKTDAKLRKQYNKIGAKAKKDGKQITDNPHSPGCMIWYWWNEGYNS